LGGEYFEIGKILPGITVEYFEMDEIERAWEWMGK
jgi:hypothetical protein